MSSKVLYVNGKTVDAEVVASDPAIKNYFLDNYIENTQQSQEENNKEYYFLSIGRMI